MSSVFEGIDQFNFANQSQLRQTFTSTYKTSGHLYSRDMMFFERTHLFEEPTQLVDVFPHCWLLFLSGSSAGLIEVETKLGWIKTPPLTALFLPPFAVIRWKIPTGPLHWRALWSRIPLPPSLEGTPFLFSWDNSKCFLTPGEVIKHIEDNQPLAKALPSELSNSRMAIKVKRFIDKNFREEMQIQDIADVLGILHEDMTHAFSNCYHVSPTQYRSHLRTRSAQMLISIDDMSATDACFESGFGDYSRFFRHFIVEIGGSPHKFSIKSKK